MNFSMKLNNDETEIIIYKYCFHIIIIQTLTAQIIYAKKLIL